MSDFSSLLASFKQSAATTSASSNSPNRPRQPTRKRPHPSANSHVRPSPSFPSMHHPRRSEGFGLSFLCIGAQKAGTTWLHTQLQKCHQLSLPVERKEVHFWDWHWKRGFEWYARQFDCNTKSAPNNSSAAKGHLIGEVTPCYVVLPPETIAEIHRCFPNLKVVFVARDMVDRAWSAMVMELRDQTMGLNPGEFAPGTGGEAKRAKKTETTMSAAQQRRIQQQSDPAAQSDAYYLDRLRSETHTSRSDYATHLRNWYEYFPAENVLVVDYRDIERDPRSVLSKVALHVGVEEEKAKAYVEGLSDEEVGQRVNVATNNAKSDSVGGESTVPKAPPLTSKHSLSQRPRLRKQMEQCLRPYATKFNILLEEKGYAWKIDQYTG